MDQIHDEIKHREVSFKFTYYLKKSSKTLCEPSTMTKFPFMKLINRTVNQLKWSFKPGSKFAEMVYKMK